MSTDAFRYRRADFGELPVKLEHMDIHLNFLDGRVEGSSVLRLTALTRLAKLRLDARELTIQSIALAGKSDQELGYEWLGGEGGIVVRFPAEIPAGHTFSIRTRVVCVPSDSVLDGIYKDTTPPDCPQQYMSQCQQWGFQRILPVIDDCRAKCTMTTTIEADARYTHLISNGNICRDRNPDGVPVLKAGDPSRKVITYVNDIPMAPYLFLCCVGTWDVLEDYVSYQSGRKVKLEYLVPPGRKEGAVIPMRILKESVVWMAQNQDYEYPREVYRTICMEKSNYGGMENVGNTTIVTSAALVDEFTTDRRLQYAHGVILHEFEHNQCGSDVTMETPFDMWLNEAFTVDVERQFMRVQFEPVWQRLDEVDAMRAPMTGPLAIEDAGHLGNIVREGFNNPDELVDGVTYVKAAEVIRMLRLILGAETFRKAKNLYFKRHDGGNANTEQFFRCFEEVSGRDLSGFRREWLHTIGYPKVEGGSSYDERARTLTLTLQQTRTGKGGCFHVPVEVAAVNGEGKEIPGTQRVLELVNDVVEVKIKDVPKPEFVSWNRDSSFYGTFHATGETIAGLVNQIRGDPNRFNRVEAMRRLTDGERIRLIKDPDAVVSSEWLEVYGAILRDKELPPAFKSFLLQVDEQSLKREYVPFYRERYRARQSLLKQVAARHMGDLVRLFRATDTYRRSVIPKEGMAERRLKNVLLRAIVEANTVNAHSLAEEHFLKAWNITDKLSTLGCIHASEHPRRRELMQEGFKLWKDQHAAYTSYLLLVGSGIHDDVFEMIAAEEQRPQFKMSHPGHSRSLYSPMALNNKMVWTDKGIRWVVDTVRKLTPVNEYCTLQVLACFQQVHNLADDLKPKVLEALKELDRAIDASVFPSVSGRIRAYLRGR